MRLLALGFLGIVSIGCGASAAGNAFTGAGASTSNGAGGSTSSGAGGATTSTGVTLTTTSQSTTTFTGEGGASTSSSSSSSSGATTSSSSGAGGSTSGDCQSDAECASGHCVAVTPGGFQVCLVPPVPATSCTGSLDQCCPSTQMLCPAGAPCFVGPLVPVCTGVQMATHNVCGVDQCTNDVDCAPGQICGVTGTLGLEIRACVTAHCKLDTDCDTYPGGVCAPVQEPCCSATAGLYCVYPALGGCRKSDDCPPTSSQPTRYCDPDPTSGIASCQPGGPVCPA